MWDEAAVKKGEAPGEPSGELFPIVGIGIRREKWLRGTIDAASRDLLLLQEIIERQ